MGAKTSKQLEIIDGAIEFAAEHGILQTNANQVAKYLGIRPSLIYYHVENESGLFEQMVKRIADINNDRVASRLAKLMSPTALKRLRVYIEENIAWGLDVPSHVAVLNHAFTSAAHAPGVAKLSLAALQAGEDKVFQMLAEGVAKAQFRLQCPVEICARLIHQSIIGALVHNLGTSAVLKSGKKRAFAHYAEPIHALVERLIVE